MEERDWRNVYGGKLKEGKVKRAHKPLFKNLDA